MVIACLPEFIRSNYELHEWRHAVAILKKDFPQEYSNIMNILTNFRLHKSQMNVGEEKSNY